MGLVEDFNNYRSKMNEKIMSSDGLIVKRIFNLDTNAYAEGHLDVKSKELIGLTCSLVLRCDDCVKYHLGKCKEVGFTTNEVNEAMGVATDRKSTRLNSSHSQISYAVFCLKKKKKKK